MSINGRSFAGENSVAGEWGHNPLPWPSPEEYPGLECFCGKRGCLEERISGCGIELDFKTLSGPVRTTRETIAASEPGDLTAMAAVDRFEDRLAVGLSVIINIIDPDAIVIGGGVSNPISSSKTIHVRIWKRSLDTRFESYPRGLERSSWSRMALA